MQPAALLATELRYCTSAGDVVRTTVAEADAGALAGGSPVRDFGWRRGQRNYPGWLWTATTGSLVGYESLLERDRVLLADFDTRVVGIASQPFWVSGRDGHEQHRHAPDYLLALRDGSVVVVDVKPAAMCQEPKVAAVLDWTGRLCRARGWRYEVFRGEDPVVMANLRFLAHGRRAMFLDQDCVSELTAAGRAGITVAEAEAQVGGFDPLDVRACALSLLWRQVWITDLSRPLSTRSVISATQPEGAVCPVAS